MRAICSYTGLSYQIKIDGLNSNHHSLLSIDSPLISQEACLKQIKHGYGHLIKLPSNVLAALTMALYRNHGLFDLKKLPVTEANNLLQHCPKELLIKLLLNGSTLSWIAIKALPSFSFDFTPDAHSLHAEAFQQSLDNYLEQILTYSLPENPNKIAVKRIMAKLGKFEVPKDRTQAFLDAEAAFIESRTEAQELLASLVDSKLLNNFKLIAIIKELLKKRNLMSADQGLKDKIAKALREFNDLGANELADIIDAVYDPFDPLGEDTKELPAVSLFDDIPDLVKPKIDPMELLLKRIGKK